MNRSKFQPSILRGPTLPKAEPFLQPLIIEKVPGFEFDPEKAIIHFEPKCDAVGRQFLDLTRPNGEKFLVLSTGLTSYDELISVDSNGNIVFGRYQGEDKF